MSKKDYLGEELYNALSAGLMEEIEAKARQEVASRETRVLDVYFAELYEGIDEILDEFTDELDDLEVDATKLRDYLRDAINSDCHIDMRG